jgi:hypothetical protein
MASSAGIFGAVADMLVAIYKASGFPTILKWVDDFFVIRLPHEIWTEHDFISLTSHMGVPWAPHKTRQLSTCQCYIGFDWDLEHRSVALPSEKLQAVLDLISDWCTPHSSFTMHEAAHLHRKLVHTSSIFPLICPFIHSVSHFTSHFISPHAQLHPLRPLLTDLSWIQDLLHWLPNELPLFSNSPVDINWWGDARTSFGVGVTVGQFWAVWSWQPGFRVGPK